MIVEKFILTSEVKCAVGMTIQRVQLAFQRLSCNPGVRSWRILENLPVVQFQ
jgi:hypothetical protein